MIRRPAGFVKLRILKAKPGQIQLLDKGIDKTHRVLRSKVVIKSFGKEQRLTPIGASYIVHAGIAACQNSWPYARSYPKTST